MFVVTLKHAERLRLFILTLLNIVNWLALVHALRRRPFQTL